MVLQAGGTPVPGVELLPSLTTENPTKVVCLSEVSLHLVLSRMLFGFYLLICLLTFSVESRLGMI